MPGIKGRSVLIRRGGVQVAGVRTKSITIGGTPIDITSDDDSGIRRLMDEPGELTVDISVSGIVINQTLRNESLQTTDRVANTEFIFGGFEGSPANSHGFIGQFFMDNYSESGDYKEAVTFEATFKSAGPVTYTPI